MQFVVSGVFWIWQVALGLGQVLSQPCLTLWKLQFQPRVTLLVFLEAPFPGSSTPPEAALLENRGQVVLGEVGCAPGEVDPQALEMQFPRVFGQ